MPLYVAPPPPSSKSKQTLTQTTIKGSVRFVLPDCRRGRGSPSRNKRLLMCICDDQGCRSVSGPSPCLRCRKRRPVALAKTDSVGFPLVSPSPFPAGKGDAPAVKWGDGVFWLVGLSSAKRPARGVTRRLLPKQTRKPRVPQSFAGETWERRRWWRRMGKGAAVFVGSALVSELCNGVTEDGRASEPNIPQMWEPGAV